MKERVKTLSQYLMGWMGYYSLANAKSILGQMDTQSSTQSSTHVCVQAVEKSPNKNSGVSNTKKGP